MDAIVRGALEAVAREKGTTVEVVRAEIGDAITRAWESRNAETAFYQQQVFCAGSRPTPEELLTHLYLKLILG